MSYLHAPMHERLCSHCVPNYIGICRFNWDLEPTVGELASVRSYWSYGTWALSPRALMVPTHWRGTYNTRIRTIYLLLYRAYLQFLLTYEISYCQPTVYLYLLFSRYCARSITVFLLHIVVISLFKFPRRLQFNKLGISGENNMFRSLKGIISHGSAYW